jgi:class 3 adenylate cyclase
MATVFAVAATVIGLLIVGWPGIIALALYVELTLEQTLVLSAFAGVTTLGLVSGSHLFFGRDFWRRLNTWVDGDRSGVAGLRADAFNYHRWVVLRSAIVASIGSVATIGTLIAIMADLSLSGFLIVAGAITMGIHSGALVIAVSFDLLLRPIREALDADEPDRLPAPAQRWGLESRLLASAAGLAYVIGTVTPVAALRIGWGPGRLAAAMGVTAVLVLVNAVGVYWFLGVRPVLRPIEDLIAGTQRVARGDFTARLAVTSDDELGQLVASFNLMQAGLTERERLHTAFGSYVDPDLAERVLAQGDELFAGEEVDVTVFFIDIRDFTAYSERVSARDAVSRLNELFGMVVPVLRQHRGHANKFSGDGLLAVFGVPEQVADHADRAVAAATEIQCCVREAFGEELRIGIGVNTGRVIAGTVGGGGKLEFALIGDPVNVAARVEQLTKETRDPILVAQATVDALERLPDGLVSRGLYQVKGKTEPIAVYGLDPFRLG